MTDYKQPQRVSTDALETLGTIIDESCGRDAIHLAVENVIASEVFYPGSHVALRDGVAYASGKLVGIVDPFLPGKVLPGQRFWLVVYPRQITSLRHVWEHPDFPTSDARTQPAPAPAAKSFDDVAISRLWMTSWAMQHMGHNYYGDDEVRPDQALEYAIEAGHSGHIGPYEGARDHINDVWWDHWEKITGEKSERRGDYFSCSC